MNLGRDLARMAFGLALVVFAAGAIVGSCAGTPSGAAVEALRDSLARAADDVAYERLVSATARRAVQRTEARSDAVLRYADSVAHAAAPVVTRVVVRERVVHDTAGRVLSTDTLIADALTAHEARHAADSVAIVALLVTRDTLSHALVQADSLASALTRQLATASALRVAVERVNRRPRFGLATGVVLGVVGTATLVQLARP